MSKSRENHTNTLPYTCHSEFNTKFCEFLTIFFPLLWHFQAIIIYVPVPKQKAFQKIQTRLVRELEKKFSGKHVVFVAERKILPKPQRNTRNPLKQKRPRSRTLTAVFDAILEDLVFPAEIVGKRIRVKLDGSQLIKVHLDKNQQTTIEHKVNIQHFVNWIELLPSCCSYDLFNLSTSV